jgi:hypothetical protein
VDERVRKITRTYLFEASQELGRVHGRRQRHLSQILSAQGSHDAGEARFAASGAANLQEVQDNEI